MTNQMQFPDPHKGQNLAVQTVGEDELEVVAHQRKARPAHVKNIVASIERIGFVVPLIVVEQDGRYVIIDGQHRFQAGKTLGVKEFPVVVVPQELARRMMNLNVEKDLNIREKSSVSLSIYRDLLEDTPDLAEDEAEVVDSIQQAHYVTLGLAYQKAARLAGSSFEPVLKRCDTFMATPLRDAYDTREQRAARILEANDLIKSITEKIKEMGAYHQFITAQILSFANPLSRKRGSAEFDETFEKLIEKLRKAEEKPESVLKVAVG